MEKIIRTKDLCEILSVSRTTLWHMEKRGSLPPRRQISSRAVGWLESEIEGWIKSQPKSENQPNNI